MRKAHHQVEKNFTFALEKNQLPNIDNLPSARLSQLSQIGLSPELLWELYTSQLQSRLLDIKAREETMAKNVFYTIGSAGHEGNAAVAAALNPSDMALLHYRSMAFYLTRARQVPGTTPLFDAWASFMAKRIDPASGGRHKVIGSYKLNIVPQTSTIASHLPRAVGVALSVGKARRLKLKSPLASDSVILTSFGDASCHHSTAQGSFNLLRYLSFQNIPLPLLLLCEDNGGGISTRTEEGWIERQFKSKGGNSAPRYFKCNGRDLGDVFHQARMAAHYVRTTQRPAFLHMKCPRLMGHAGSDIETNYRSLSEIESTESLDPLLVSSALMQHFGLVSHPRQLLDFYFEEKERVHAVFEQLKDYPHQDDIRELKKTLRPNPAYTAHLQRQPPMPPENFRELRAPLFDKDAVLLKKPAPMSKLINWALKDIMLRYPQAVVFGEDVGKKGGVYNVTANLQNHFGRARVFNSPLDEQAILGAGLGLALNGFLPIPEIQFLAYLANTIDQIRGEGATQSFFSNGKFQNPMVVRVPGLAYQKGFGGHFHNDNSLGLLLDVPGLLIAVPSRGDLAVQALRRALFEAHTHGRLSVIIEPIALYGVRDLHVKGDELWAQKYEEPPEGAPPMALGDYRTAGPKNAKLLLISFGNGSYFSEQARKILEEEHGLESRLLDLVWLSPLPLKEIAREASQHLKILIVDECRKTGGGPSAQIASYLLTQTKSPPQTAILAAEDCFIPLGPQSRLSLPTVDKIVNKALELVTGKTEKKTTLKREKRKSS